MYNVLIFFLDLDWLSTNTHFSPANIVEWHKVGKNGNY